jgi:hypothetical protein
VRGLPARLHPCHLEGTDQRGCAFPSPNPRKRH